MKEPKFNYFKEFKRINRILDLDYSKLYDKYHDLELSHNRLERLVRQFVNCFDYYEWYLANPTCDKVYEEAIRELKNPLYRVRERKKGGKKCV